MANVGLYSQNISFEKIFLSGIETEQWSYTNPTGSAISFSAGTVFGIIPGVAGTVRDTQSGSSDGSQAPYGLLLNDITVAGSATVTITLVVGGIINAGKVIFSNGTDTLNTTVTISAVVFGTMHSMMTKGGILPKTDAFGDYYDEAV